MFWWNSANDYPPVTPRLYEICQSLAGTPDGSASPYTVASIAREKIFDFDYTLTNKLNKTDFETNILNHFLMRRIGLETYAYWKLKLRDKILSLTPYYNKLFEQLYTDILFETERTTKTTDDYNSQFTNTYDTTTTDVGENSNTFTPQTTDKTINDNRFSNTPQGLLSDVQNGSYMTEYTLTENTLSHEGSDKSQGNTKNTNTHSGTDTNAHSGTDTHTTVTSLTPAEQLDVWTKFNESVGNVMLQFYKELDDLFLIYV